MVHLVEVERNGEARQFVLKHLMQGELSDRQRLIEREAHALRVLAAAGIAAPRYEAATSGADTGDVSALLMSRLPGEVWLTPRDPRAWLEEMARTLARMHALAVPDGLPSEEVSYDPLRPPADSSDHGLWQRVEEVLAAPAPVGTGLIHGDYQHFNVLWQDERLSGVVDWIWAGVGHPDCDVGHCQLNLAVLFTPQWAADFVSAYEAEAGRRTEPWWVAFELSRYARSDWQQFIPIQVAGRAPVDVAGMTTRVEDMLRRALDH